MKSPPFIKIKKEIQEIDIVRIKFLIEDGWSFHMALSKANMSCYYGKYLRYNYPEFDQYIKDVIQLRKKPGGFS